jgi:ABC-type sulfate transport system permease component
MSSQANSVTVTSVIFMVDLPFVIPALVAGIHLAACSGD